MREPFEIRYLPRRKQENGTDWNLYFLTTTYLSVLKSSNYLAETSAKSWLYVLQSHICQLRKLPHLGGMYNGLCQYYHIWDCFCTWWTGSSQWTNDKILGFPTLAHRRHLPQNLLNYLSIYWTTSESTELPENLLNYLRIYWTTWEFTELPENLLNYLTIYWTTWEFTELPHNLLNYLRFLLNYLRFLLNYLGFCKLKL